MKIQLTLTCPPFKNTNVVKNEKKLESKIIYAKPAPARLSATMLCSYKGAPFFIKTRCVHQLNQREKNRKV
ncbi:MAG: hypothetical protein GDA51_06595 [Ekhidna sp.]|nr:hypothetical protein [Ekhidna sp.]